MGHSASGEAAGSDASGSARALAFGFPFGLPLDLGDLAPGVLLFVFGDAGVAGREPDLEAFGEAARDEPPLDDAAPGDLGGRTASLGPAMCEAATGFFVLSVFLPESMRAFWRSLVTARRNGSFRLEAHI